MLFSYANLDIYLIDAYGFCKTVQAYLLYALLDTQSERFMIYSRLNQLETRGWHWNLLSVMSSNQQIQGKQVSNTPTFTVSF